MKLTEDEAKMLLKLHNKAIEASRKYWLSISRSPWTDPKERNNTSQAFVNYLDEVTEKEAR